MAINSRIHDAVGSQESLECVKAFHIGAPPTGNWPPISHSHLTRQSNSGLMQELVHQMLPRFLSKDDWMLLWKTLGASCNPFPNTEGYVSHFWEVMGDTVSRTTSSNCHLSFDISKSNYGEVDNIWIW